MIGLELVLKVFPRWLAFNGILETKQCMGEEWQDRLTHFDPIAPIVLARLRELSHPGRRGFGLKRKRQQRCSRQCEISGKAIHLRPQQYSRGLLLRVWICNRC